MVDLLEFVISHAAQIDGPVLFSSMNIEFVISQVSGIMVDIIVDML